MRPTGSSGNAFSRCRPPSAERWSVRRSDRIGIRALLALALASHGVSGRPKPDTPAAPSSANEHSKDEGKSEPREVSKAEGEGYYMLFMLGSLLPSEVGADTETVSGSKPRFRLGWAYQIPFGIFSTNHDWPKGQVPLMRHRLVLAIRLGFGQRVDPDSGDEETVTADVRLGYRYRFPHHHALAPFLGMGTTIDGWPEGRASLSPELGIHLGRDCVPCLGATVGAQADFFATGNTVRLMGFVGWTVW